MYLSSLGGTHKLVNSFESGASASAIAALSSDEELLRLCAKGNNSALEELVRRYQSPLARLLSRLLSSPEDVEETLLHVFVQAWQYAPRFQYRSRVSTWLYRIAVNLAHDLYKQGKRQPPRVEIREEEIAHIAGNAEEEALQRLRQQDQARSLNKALAQLHPTDRLLLVLYYYEQMDYAKIQEITQLSYTVLKMRLTRARKRLRQFLEEEDREARL